MGRFSELEADLDDLARSYAVYGTDTAMVRSALQARFGPDVAAWFAGRHDFYAGNLDAWRREDAIHDLGRAAGHRATFSRDARYVVDVHDNDDEP